ncbi:OmpA family protein [Aquabacterium sp. A08]|uniref:OmpA family protein n=1 Tax=Aquabacterium sp. A08 TaxID=2718532 RepID=UPI001421FA96|nr:OmpA family protein [Aquabacterium sp. A08]NIC42582.1 OmpA family protein [Aquabacterium sp. A08]
MRTFAIAATALAATVLVGCANMSEEQKAGTGRGALIGAAAGAVLGAVTDGSSGAAKGAVIGAGVGAVGGHIWSTRMEEQKRQMEASTRGTGVEVTQTADNQLKLNIPSDVSFAVGRADIQPNFRPILDTFAQGLVKNPQARVTIIGHTDSTGSDAVNNPLSVNRAASVRDYLTARGVPAGVIAIDGRGAREPIASNATAEGRARNRRVEMFMAEPAR